MKKLSLIFIFVIALTGCNISKNTISDSTMVPTQDSSLVDYIIKTNPSIICNTPLDKTVFTKYEDWNLVVNTTDNAIIKEIAPQFDTDYFNEYSLCYVPIVNSAGMEYKVESVSISDSNGQKTLTINTSYSTDKILNTQVCYEFFITVDTLQNQPITNIEFIHEARN